MPYGRASDDDLMGFFIAGDKRAMEELFARYRRQVYSWLLRSSPDHSTAEDLYQDAWLRVIRGARGYRAGNFRAWLWRIVRNAAADAAGKMRPSLTLDAAAGAEGEEWSAVDDVRDERLVGALERMEAAERRERVAAAVAALPPEQREVVLLRTVAELGYREISETLGIPLGTALSRMRLAVERLRKSILEEEA